jgi:hypothetical protein
MSLRIDPRPRLIVAPGLSVPIRATTTLPRGARHTGYRLSQVIRKRIEEHFGWGKTAGRIRQTTYRGLKRVDQHFKLTMTASNLARIARMLAAVKQGAVQ